MVARTVIAAVLSGVIITLTVIGGATLLGLAGMTLWHALPVSLVAVIGLYELSARL